MVRTASLNRENIQADSKAAPNTFIEDIGLSPGAVAAFACNPIAISTWAGLLPKVAEAASGPGNRVAAVSPDKGVNATAGVSLADALAGVRDYGILSIVGADRLPGAGCYGAKVGRGSLLKAFCSGFTTVSWLRRRLPVGRWSPLL